MLSRKKTCKAFTLVEILLAMTLLGILMTALAIAFDASTHSYQQNEDLLKATNTARQVLIRMTTELRTASAVDTNEPATQCSLFTASGSNITYQYDSSNSELLLITNDDLSDSDYLLCDNVTSLAFTKDTALDNLGAEYVKSVKMSITVSIGTTAKTLATAVVIRKNL